MEELSWARIVLAVVIMAAASVSDWRTRTASDGHWYALGAGGALLFGWQLWTEGAPWSHYLCLTLMALVFVDLLRDRPGLFEEGVQLVPLALYVMTGASYAYLTVRHYGGPGYWALVTVPLLFVLFFVLYQLDVIKGGADAKALIALSLCFPVYPVLEGLPLLALNTPSALEVLPFSLLVLLNAAILTLLVPMVMFVMNLLRRDLRFPLMLFGVRMSVDQAKGRHVWPMEHVVEGRISTTLFPRADEEEDWEALTKAGVDRPWVTPKVPFLIPLTLGVPFSLLVGNPVFYLIGA
jgi:preflagellin peptidase FlaK